MIGGSGQGRPLVRHLTKEAKDGREVGIVLDAGVFGGARSAFTVGASSSFARGAGALERGGDVWLPKRVCQLAVGSGSGPGNGRSTGAGQARNSHRRHDEQPAAATGCRGL